MVALKCLLAAKYFACTNRRLIVFIPAGQFGPVYRANRQMENVCVPVALKPIKSRLSSEADVSNFLKEIAVLKCVHHPNVAQVLGLVNEGT